MGRFIAPVQDKVSQNFGDNPDYYRSLGQNGHTGIDYACWPETPVKASGDGIVAFEGWGQNHDGFRNVAGIAVLLDHGDVYTGYAHLNSTTVSIGQRVEQGDIIGYSGATGQVMGPHLHFEFWGKPTNWKNGWAGRVNPSDYLSNDKEDDMRQMSREELIWNYRTIAGQEPTEANLQAWLNSGADYITTNEIMKRDFANAGNAFYQYRERTERLITELREQAKVSASVEVKLKELEAENSRAVEEARLAVERSAALEAQAAADKEAGESALRRLGQFITKYLPGGK